MMDKKVTQYLTQQMNQQKKRGVLDAMMTPVPAAMERPKIAVLFGGCSSEYAISLASAYGVLTHLPAAYEVLPIGITNDGRWFQYTGALKDIEEDTWWQRQEALVPVMLSPDRALHGLVVFLDEGVTTVRLDAVFPILHGKHGEDGSIQGLCALAGIPVIGCGLTSSAIGMDKYAAQVLVQSAGIKTTPSRLFTKQQTSADILQAAAQLKLPFFVKPVSAGSSLGVTKVTQLENLAAACEAAFDFDDRIVVEEAVAGVEVGCAVVGNHDLQTGAIDEIQLAGDTFDFTEKYTLMTAKIHVPARISAAKTREIQVIAKQIFHLLGCKNFARVDLFLTPTGVIYFNEVNTIPGFTSHSRFPMMMQAAGMDFAALLKTLIALELPL